jgi:MFS family permease
MPVPLVLAITFLGAIASIFFAFFPVFGTALGISAFELGVMLFFFGLIRVFFFSKAPKIKAGLHSRILLASLGFFLVYLGNRFIMYVGVVLVGAALSLIYAYTLEYALQGDDLSVRRRAGMFEGLLGIGSMVGPFLAGFVAEFSYAYTFMMVVLASLLLVVGLKLSGPPRDLRVLL